MPVLFSVIQGSLRLVCLHFTVNCVKRSCNTAANMPSALVILAAGAEEMETVITVDVLRRGGVGNMSVLFRLALHPK